MLSLVGSQEVWSAVQQRGREKKGPPDIAQNPSPKKVQNGALSVP